MRTLNDHGVAFRFNFLAGTPYYDENGEIEGYYKAEPIWREEDLTPDQLAELDEWVAQHLSARPEDGEMFVRWATMERNGVQHTHRRGTPIYERRPLYGYICAMCESAIVLPDPGDAPFHGGPLDGRWIVTGGVQVWRVPLPEPLTLAEDDPYPTMKIAEYRRGRDGEYYIDRQTL